MDQLLVIWEPPLTDLDDPALRAQARYRIAIDAALPVYAKFYVALVEQVRMLGYRPNLVEIANEPDGAWNMKLAPSQYVQLLAALRKEAQASGLSLPRVAGPGTAFLSSMQDFMSDRRLSLAMLRLMDVVSVHVWDDRLGRDAIMEARRVRRMLDDLGWHDPIMVSEFAPNYHATDDRTVLRAPDARRAPYNEEGMASNYSRYAAVVAQRALGLAVEGFNPLVYWQLKDQSWGSTSYGLLDADGHARPALKTLVELSAATETGSITSVESLGSATERLFALQSRHDVQALVATNTSKYSYGLQLSRDTYRSQNHVTPCFADERDELLPISPDSSTVFLRRTFKSLPR